MNGWLVDGVGTSYNNQTESKKRTDKRRVKAKETPTKNVSRLRRFKCNDERADERNSKGECDF